MASSYYRAMRDRIINYYDNYKVLQACKVIGIDIDDDVHNLTFEIENLTDQQVLWVFEDLGGRDEDLEY